MWACGLLDVFTGAEQTDWSFTWYLCVAVVKLVVLASTVIPAVFCKLLSSCMCTVLMGVLQLLRSITCSEPAPGSCLHPSGSYVVARLLSSLVLCRACRCFMATRCCVRQAWMAIRPQAVGHCSVALFPLRLNNSNWQSIHCCWSPCAQALLLVGPSTVHVPCQPYQTYLAGTCSCPGLSSCVPTDT